MEQQWSSRLQWLRRLELESEFEEVAANLTAARRPSPEAGSAPQGRLGLWTEDTSQKFPQTLGQ